MRRVQWVQMAFLLSLLKMRSICIIAFYLTFIINTSISTGVFPHAWKNAHVIPLFKKSDFNDVNNFRPISILPVLSKILEKKLCAINF